MRLYVGIDPGKSGGCAVLTASRQPVRIFAYTTTRDAVEALRESVDGCDACALLEQVHSMPKQGVASSFAFGRNYGEWIGILTTLGISFACPTPQSWMRAMGIGGKKRDRYASRRLAQDLFPHVAVVNATRDALLLAEYCRRLESRE